jgi:hypothetical protein
VVTLRLELKEPIVVPHHPIVADRTGALQPENLLQFGCARHLEKRGLESALCPHRSRYDAVTNIHQADEKGRRGGFTPPSAVRFIGDMAG